MRPIAPPLAALALLGCDFVRSASAPLPGLRLSQSEHAENDCLLVALPGLGDDWRDLEEHLEDEWRAHGEGCDLLLLDAHFTYYREQVLAERLRDDVLVPARARGYGSVWILGISLGGYGALWSAERSAALVDGLILVAPMIAMPPRGDDVAARIREEGGLAAWQASGPRRHRHRFGDAEAHWRWLQERLRTPEGPAVVLAYGERDRHASSIALLADALPPERVYRHPGGHDWPTWRALLGEVFLDRPWRDRR